MRRVCQPGGRIVILNHFKSDNAVLSRIETAISPMTVHIGFKSDLDLPGFLAQADLTPISIEKVNLPPMWTLVTCVKDHPLGQAHVSEATRPATRRAAFECCLACLRFVAVRTVSPASGSAASSARRRPR